jgi:hypothetical protein
MYHRLPLSGRRRAGGVRRDLLPGKYGASAASPPVVRERIGLLRRAGVPSQRIRFGGALLTTRRRADSSTQSHSVLLKVTSHDPASSSVTGRHRAAYGGADPGFLDCGWGPLL